MARKRTREELPNPKNNLWDFVAFYLRFQRNARKLSGTDLGKIIGLSSSQVSRIEIGEDRLDGTRAALIDEAWDTGGLFGLLVWYASIGHDPQWFAQYVELEQGAGMLRIYQALTIPGLLQTADYARALLAAGIEMNREAVLAARMQRQTLLTRNPHMTVIMAQNAIEWPVGSPEIMRNQLARLLEVAELPNVVLRIVPRTWEVGAFTGLTGSFQLLSGDAFGDVAYTEAPGSGRLVSSPPDVRTYGMRYEHIGAKALPPERSVQLIRDVMEAIE